MCKLIEDAWKDAKDLAQGVFVRAFERIDTFRGASVFILVGTEDLSYQQAAEVLGLTVKAVRMRRSRARRELREKLKNYVSQ